MKLSLDSYFFTFSLCFSLLHMLWRKRMISNPFLEQRANKTVLKTRGLCLLCYCSRNLISGKTHVWAQRQSAEVYTESFISGDARPFWGVPRSGIVHKINQYVPGGFRLGSSICLYINCATIIYKASRNAKEQTCLLLLLLLVAQTPKEKTGGRGEKKQEIQEKSGTERQPLW